jgi:hypothetical protein
MICQINNYKLLSVNTNSLIHRKTIRTFFLLLACLLFGLKLSGQPGHLISVYAKMEGNYVLYDRAMDKATGFGTGVEMDINLPSGLRPFLGIHCNIFPTNAVATFINGVELEKKQSLLSVFAGTSYPVFRNFYVSLEAGPAFINSDVYLGIKPGVSYFVDRKQRMSVAVSLTHIFEADHSDDGSFGYADLGLVFRVF